MDDLYSNTDSVLVDASASLAAAANRSTTAFDMAMYKDAIFHVNVTDVGTGGELTVKLQYSDDDSTYTDEPDTDAGNSTSVVIDAVGLTQLHVPNPRGRYLEINGAAATDAVVYSVVAIGNKRYVEPTV